METEKVQPVKNISQPLLAEKIPLSAFNVKVKAANALIPHRGKKISIKDYSYSFHGDIGDYRVLTQIEDLFQKFSIKMEMTKEEIDCGWYHFVFQPDRSALWAGKYISIYDLSFTRGIVYKKDKQILEEIKTIKKNIISAEMEGVPYPEDVVKTYLEEVKEYLRLFSAKAASKNESDSYISEQLQAQGIKPFVFEYEKS